MNKKAITIFAVVGLALGSYIPILLEWDPTGLNGPSILGGFIGGLLGIWLGIKIGKMAG